MDWLFEYLPDQGVLVITTAGPVTPDSLPEFLDAAVAESDRLGTRTLLVDHRDSPVELSLLDFHQLPRVEIKHGLTDKHRVAFVVATATMAMNGVRHYENREFNNGLPRRTFLDREAALDWLLNGPSPR